MKAITIGILAGIGISAFIFMNLFTSVTGSATRGEYDAFAQCLTDNGAIFYGSFQCTYCTTQKVMFGPSIKNINYVECGPLQGPMNLACVSAGVDVFPTWTINGTKYDGVQTIDVLSKLSGCRVDA